MPAPVATCPLGPQQQNPFAGLAAQTVLPPTCPPAPAFLQQTPGSPSMGPLHMVGGGSVVVGIYHIWNRWRMMSALAALSATATAGINAKPPAGSA